MCQRTTLWSLLLLPSLCGFRESNGGHQKFWQAPLPVETALWPKMCLYCLILLISISVCPCLAQQKASMHSLVTADDMPFTASDRDALYALCCTLVEKKKKVCPSAPSQASLSDLLNWLLSLSTRVWDGSQEKPCFWEARKWPGTLEITQAPQQRGTLCVEIVVVFCLQCYRGPSLPRHSFALKLCWPRLQMLELTEFVFCLEWGVGMQLVSGTWEITF